jgi:glycolate oxidase FAD binding subunit
MAIAIQAAGTQETAVPSDAAGVAEDVRAAYESNEAILPVGGGTALDYGNPPSRPGRRLDLSGLAKVVDYTPRDMTILVEAGIRMADLAATLAGEGQQLPIDVPRASEATLGGVVATNWNGPRRYGHGTIRDYVIGIHAVDGRGVAFKGGGRVVKNVAGYDFCKLLTGSLGTLGVITQVALKVKPQPESVGVIVADCRDLATADDALGRLAMLEAPPVGIDVLVGGAWGEAVGGESATTIQISAGGSIRLVVRIEGTAIEVDWLADRVQTEVGAAGAANAQRLEAETMNSLWERQVEFSDKGAGASDDGSPLVLQFAVPPSDVIGVVAKVLAVDVDCSIQAHAASGIIVARFSKFTHSDLTAVLVGKLRPAATQVGGNVSVVRSNLDGLTPHLVWGGRTDAVVLLERIKRKFDPKNILNPGKYIY